MNRMDTLVTAEEVALYLRLPVQRVWAMARRTDLLPAGVVVKFPGRTVRFNLQRLEEWVAQGGTAKRESKEGEFILATRGDSES